MTDDQLLFAIHSGIYDANRTFEQWSGGWWLDTYGVEAFMTVKVAEAIMALPSPPGYLTLEAPISEIKAFSGNKPESLKDLNDKRCTGGRADIALYDKNENLTHILEAKLYWASEHSVADIERIAKLVSALGTGEGTIRSGIYFQFMSWQNEGDDCENFNNYLDTWTENEPGWLRNLLDAASKGGRKLEYTFQTGFNTGLEPMRCEGRVATSLCLVIRPA